MRFKADENLPVEVAELLRQHQHDALSVQDQQMAGQGDPQIARVCQTEGRALVTCDLDFADIRAYPPDNYHGIIVLRPAVQSVSSLLRLVNRVLPLIDVEPLDGHIWVVDDHRIRIRGTGPQGNP
jgi:predicted nuclease of predicted toxin-antitoxin system